MITDRFAGAAVHTNLDVGSGPGVGSCILAGAFPEAMVTAVDASEALVVRAAARTERLGIGARVSTRVGDLGEGLSTSEPVDLVWVSMMLHPVHDQEAALGTLRGVLRVGGWLAIAEFGAPLVCIPPDELDADGGLLDRCQAAVRDWLPDQLPTGPASPNGQQMALQSALERTGSATLSTPRSPLSCPLRWRSRPAGSSCNPSFVCA